MPQKIELLTKNLLLAYEKKHTLRKAFIQETDVLQRDKYEDDLTEIIEIISDIKNNFHKDYPDKELPTLTIQKQLQYLQEELELAERKYFKIREALITVSDASRKFELKKNYERFKEFIKQLEKEKEFLKSPEIVEKLKIEAETKNPKVEAEIKLAIERQWNIEQKEKEDKSSHKIIGSLAQETIIYFKNREQELKDLRKYLSNETTERLINIIGPAGMGKTSLVAKLVKELRQNYNIEEQKISGIVIIQLRKDELNLTKIFEKFGKLLGRKEELDKIWNSQSDLTKKIEYLLNIIKEDYYLLVLDNFETQLNENKIKSEEIQIFFEILLSSEYKGKILITSREPIKWTHKHKKVCKELGLDKGLPEQDAIQLLIDLGKDVIQIIEAENEKNGKKGKLKQIVIKAKRIPRALETIVGILKDKPLYSLDDLLNKESLWCDEVLKGLIADQYNSLFPDAQQIIQVLSVYNKDIKREAILSIFEGIEENLENILNRLINNYIIQYNRKADTFCLHPLTQQYVYYTLEDEEKKELEIKCADFYKASEKPQDEWKSLEDLQAHIQEIKHLTRAELYERAARVLKDISFDYLMLWGHAKLVKQLWENLIYELKTPDLQMRAYNDLGVVYQCLGKVRESIPLLEKGLEIAKDEEDKYWIGAFTGNLGLAYSDLSEYQKAIKYSEQALKIAIEIGDRQGKGATLDNLGLAYGGLGEYQKAIEYFGQALEIAREIGNRRGEGAAIGNLGLAYSNLGNYQKAIEYYEQALEILEEIGAKAGEANVLNNLAVAYANLEDYKQAKEYYEKSLLIDRWLGNPISLKGTLRNLIWVCEKLGDKEGAEEYRREVDSL